jgi:hypothetical protein
MDKKSEMSVNKASATKLNEKPKTGTQSEKPAEKPKASAQSDKPSEKPKAPKAPLPTAPPTKPKPANENTTPRDLDSPISANPPAKKPQDLPKPPVTQKATSDQSNFPITRRCPSTTEATIEGR